MYPGIFLNSRAAPNRGFSVIPGSEKTTSAVLYRGLSVFKTRNPTVILYETLVRPKLEYVSSTWDAYQSSLITSAEDMQNR